jgi:transcriptional regulator with XRE-family HTH domain
LREKFGKRIICIIDFRTFEVKHFFNLISELIMTIFGEKIRSLRKAAGLSMEELGLRIGASKSSIWELENKPTVRPSADRVTELAKIFAVTPEFLMDDAASKPTVGVADVAFFRRYQTLDETKKQQLQDILQVLDRQQ